MSGRIRSAAGRRRAAALVALALAAANGGCGGDDGYANRAREPDTLTLSVFVGERQIAASPERFGAGPTRVVITNRGKLPRSVTLSGPRLERTVQLGPQETANFRVTLAQGLHTIEAGDGSVPPFDVDVGPERPSAQDQLLQP